MRVKFEGQTYLSGSGMVGRVENSEKLFVDDQVTQSVLRVEDGTIDGSQAQSAVGGVESLTVANCALDNFGGEGGGIG
jgi:hypothetical protein